MIETISGRRVAFTTLGCKVNQSETDLLARQFVAAGYECVGFDEPADVYVVNTCTVTHVADRKSRQVLGQAMTDTMFRAPAASGLSLSSSSWRKSSVTSTGKGSSTAT